MEFFFFAFIPLAVFLIYYSYWVLNTEKRKKHLTGIKGLSLLLSVSFQQALGYLIYALICETSTFHRFVYYTDEEYEMFDYQYNTASQNITSFREDWYFYLPVLSSQYIFYC